MNITQEDKQYITEASYDRLQELLCSLEFERMQDAHRNNKSRLGRVESLIDAICGEMFKRDKTARNDREPRWEVPAAPKTYYELMSLGNGEVG